MKSSRPLSGPLSLLVAAALSACAQPGTQQLPPGRLAPVAQRITDETIARDLRVFAELQRRHDRLAAEPTAGLAPAAYALAKARCWLQAGEHQYRLNDRSAFPDEALREALGLLDAVEGETVIPTRTPLVNGATRLRDDLRSRGEALKAHPGLACAAASLACAEVALVQAGDRQARFGAPAARAHEARAEVLVGQAEREARACGVGHDEPASPTAPPAGARATQEALAAGSPAFTE